MDCETNMIIAFLIAYLFFSPANANAQNYIVKVDRVIDGDTFVINTQHESPMIQELGLHIRVKGLDTPEIKGKCDKEKTLAKTAKEFLADLLEENYVILTNIEWDKFGGRIVADVFMADHQNLTNILISKKLGISYFGEKKTKDWCK